ncbi:MAG: hypothetical protein A3C04_01090 [Candidatus Wildermuthbacteria bacterium RIFCSPHIGHO2_02_FULL_45_25]|uniref:histidine kinase n=1 Tax=Candidatus Wildermuthbacteria bacterium RIFCSPHIGHO2_02_FULL_45_25 TaxID=1802450 RepID=A0A1G2R4Y0_9BACT|nr:MAG: hypothetical protein A3C04_01090 [Candidatus Wildermuthbacteria bacterium RIFCSPHIGHO2_02_FULL_45_25]
MTVRSPLLSNELLSRIKALEPLKVGLDALQDHVVVTDENGNILYMNKAAEGLTGFPEREALGKNPGDLWGGQMTKEFYEKMWERIKVEKQPFVGEVQNKRKDGTLYWQELHISPILDEANGIKFFIAIEPNISDRKEKEKFKEEFISILAHQLKNPLATMKWALDFLLHEEQPKQKDRYILENLYRQNDALLDLVGDLMVLAKVGDINKAPITFDLQKEIEMIVADEKKRHTHVNLQFRKNAQEFPLKANRSLVGQVFQNVLDNAAEYADVSDPRVAVVLAKGKNSYHFSCENNGFSIPAQDQARIFSKFFRASNVIQVKEKGTGLGLFIVKTICDYLGWKVSFQSPPAASSNGTIFFVEIPLSQI